VACNISSFFSPHQTALGRDRSTLPFFQTTSPVVRARSFSTGTCTFLILEPETSRAHPEVGFVLNGLLVSRPLPPRANEPSVAATRPSRSGPPFFHHGWLFLSFFLPRRLRSSRRNLSTAAPCFLFPCWKDRFFSRRGLVPPLSPPLGHARTLNRSPRAFFFGGGRRTGFFPARKRPFFPPSCLRQVYTPCLPTWPFPPGYLRGKRGRFPPRHPQGATGITRLPSPS